MALVGLLAQEPERRSGSGWRQGNRDRRAYDTSTVVIVEGRVVRLEKSIFSERMSYGVHLLLESGLRTIVVHLGPLWFIESLETEIRAGDLVKVEGSLVEADAGEALVAARILRGEEVIKLRDAAGVPVWSGWRRTLPDTSDVGCVLQGSITDSSGASIPGAIVVLEPTYQQVTTKTDGSFCFPEAELETSGLVVIAQGFAEKRVSPIQLAVTGPTQLNLVLTPAVVTETVTVTSATRTVKRLEEVPVRTEVVLPELIELSASRTLADAMEFTPGIRVENSCQNCNFSQIRMLGLQGPYSQILFDGQPSMSSLAQVYGIEQIPSRMVERIEVVKGGGSAVYGPGSVGGVVNIISHTPSGTGGFVQARQEWMDGVPNQSLSASADWISSDHDTALTGFGQLDRVKPLDLTGDGYTEVCKRDFEAMGVRFKQNVFGQNAELTFDFNHVREDRRGGDRLDLPPDQAKIAEAINSRRYAAGVGWHHTPNTGFDYRLTLSLANTGRDTYYGAGMDPDAYGLSQNSLWVADSQFNHFLTSHVLTWGAQVTSDGIEDQQPAYERVYDETYRNVGFFAQDDWFFAPGWELVYGARVDKHTEIKHAIISPRVALMWSTWSTWTLRASAARGFLPPQVFDEDLHITQVGGEGQIIRNAEDLREEHSNTYMLGAEWKPSWGRGVGLVEWNLFYTGLEDLFNVVEDDDPATKEKEFTRINCGKARVYGAEVSVGYAIGSELELQVGFVEQRSRFNEAEPDFNSKDFFRTPNRYGIATFIYRNARFVDVFFGARFSGEMKMPHYAGYIPEDRLETCPPHWTLDASMSKSLPFGADSQLVVTVGGKNLTDYYQDDLDQGPKRDAGYIWGPRFPRSFYVGVSVEF
jgi:outer membrane receptor for ferrienterochelin and colicins